MLHFPQIVYILTLLKSKYFLILHMQRIMFCLKIKNVANQKCFKIIIQFLLKYSVFHIII